MGPHHMLDRQAGLRHLSPAGPGEGGDAHRAPRPPPEPRHPVPQGCGPDHGAVRPQPGESALDPHEREGCPRPVARGYLGGSPDPGGAEDPGGAGQGPGTAGVAEGAQQGQGLLRRGVRQGHRCDQTSPRSVLLGRGVPRGGVHRRDQRRATPGLPALPLPAGLGLQPHQRRRQPALLDHLAAAAHPGQGARDDGGGHRPAAAGGGPLRGRVVADPAGHGPGAGPGPGPRADRPRGHRRGVPDAVHERSLPRAGGRVLPPAGRKGAGVGSPGGRPGALRRRGRFASPRGHLRGGWEARPARLSGPEGARGPLHPRVGRGGVWGARRADPPGGPGAGRTPGSGAPWWWTECGFRTGPWPSWRTT